MAQISFRVQDEFKELLLDVARMNGRDLSKEVLYRLKKSLRDEKLLKPDITERQLDELAKAIRHA